jgi:hypothetical protein
VAEASAFGDRGAAEAQRLGLTDPGALRVLGDGAAGLCNLAERHVAGADEVLDLRHGAEHLADGARAACAQGSAPARAPAKVQAQRGKERRLADGYWGVTAWVGELAAAAPPGGDGAALGEVLN